MLPILAPSAQTFDQRQYLDDFVAIGRQSDLHAMHARLPLAKLEKARNVGNSPEIAYARGTTIPRRVFFPFAPRLSRPDASSSAGSIQRCPSTPPHTTEDGSHQALWTRVLNGAARAASPSAGPGLGNSGFWNFGRKSPGFLNDERAALPRPTGHHVLLFIG